VLSSELLVSIASSFTGDAPFSASAQPASRQVYLSMGVVFRGEVRAVLATVRAAQCLGGVFSGFEMENLDGGISGLPGSGQLAKIVVPVTILILGKVTEIGPAV